MKHKCYQFLDELGKLLDKYNISALVSGEHGNHPVDFVSNGMKLRIAGYLDGKFAEVIILRPEYTPEVTQDDER